MAKKPTAFGITPRAGKPAASLDEFVGGKAPLKRLTIDITEDLHTQIKLIATRQKTTIRDLVVKHLADLAKTVGGS
jgi:hypothetical protein